MSKLSTEGIEEIVGETTDEIQDNSIEESELTEEQTENLENIPTEGIQEEPKSIKELARDKLREKIDEGYDLANKTEKARICHEIADDISNILGSCSYDAVAKEVRFVLKAKKKEESKTTDDTKTVDGHSIKTKKTSKLKRPKREETEVDPNTLNEFEQKALILKQMQESGESAEEMMISFTLQDVSFFIEALGLPKPQIKKLKARAKQITMFNEIQRVKGTPENVISISDSILKPLMMLGIATTFLEPVVKKYFPQDTKKSKSTNGIEVEDKSLRD